MSQAPSRSCGCCGRTIATAHARSGGLDYCTTCYAREFRPTPCAGCGKPVRTPGGVGPARCKRCQIGDRRCIRCDKLTPRASYTTEAGVACAACAKFFKPPQECSLCHKLSRYVARDFKAGFIEPTCQNCRSRSFITCPHCGKHRPAAGRIGGRSVCAKCLVRKGEAFVCPDCGMPGRRHSAARCHDCYWRGRASQAITDGAGTLHHPWACDAFAAFGERLISQVTSQKAALALPRHVGFFAKIETLAEHPKRITASAIVELLGIDGIRRHRLALGFLLKDGIIPSTLLELEEAVEESRHRRVLAAAKDRWYTPILEKFYDDMLQLRALYERRGWTGRRSRFTLGTISRALRAASLFLSECHAAGIASVQLLTTSQVDRFCLVHPGYRPTLSRFVRYLNRHERLFSQIDIHLLPAGLSQGLLLSTERYQELLSAWIHPKPVERKLALICLLLLLYAQPVRDIVRLKLSDLQIDEAGIYKIAFRRAEIRLHPSINRIFGEYLSSRRPLSTMEDIGDNDHVFPGWLATDHLTEAAVSNFLRKYKVSARQIFSSALHQFCLNGCQQPKVLVKALGVSMPTAMKYVNLVQPRLTAEFERSMPHR